eukprot:Blabericola_migrator_1__286@NODE_1074_length_5530_cov_12_224602_g737_i0_p2_GENE_NODE_1074_length_5530_cov_12_224602_g737_i0NODE_1074_length_5530_cov_12_224602_g737_i0_p2_ORF_typecomplete_len390_score9_45rve/PF00665_26/5_9e21Integrase_H2C2/PF17921_1/8_6e17_NODE_1074_length_5530_cov_12_224602_g737_i02421411
MEMSEADQAYVRKLRRENGVYANQQGQIFISEAGRRAILRYIHDGHFGMHRGSRRMVRRLRRHVFWPKMHLDCREYARHCLTCQRRRPANALRTPGTALILRIFDVVAIDIWTITARGRKHKVLTAMDLYSRFPAAFRLTDVASSEEVWKKLYTGWITLFGVPNCLIHDNDARFNSQYLQEVCSRFGIGQSFSAPYHPQSKGISEGFHRNRVQCPCSMGFDTILNTILYVVRSTPNPATHMPSFLILIGEEMILPHFQAYGRYSGRPFRDKLQWLQSLREELNDFYLQRALQTGSQEPFGSQVGDLVVVRLHGSKQQSEIKKYGDAKVTPLWSLPRRVTEVSKRGRSVKTSSLWNKRNVQVSHEDDVRVSPKTISKDQTEAAIEELYFK